MDRITSADSGTGSVAICSVVKTKEYQPPSRRHRFFRTWSGSAVRGIFEGLAKRRWSWGAKFDRKDGVDDGDIDLGKLNSLLEENLSQMNHPAPRKSYEEVLEEKIHTEVLPEGWFWPTHVTEFRWIREGKLKKDFGGNSDLRKSSARSLQLIRSIFAG